MGGYLAEVCIPVAPCGRYVAATSAKIVCRRRLCCGRFMQKKGGAKVGVGGGEGCMRAGVLVRVLQRCLRERAVLVSVGLLWDRILGLSWGVVGERYDCVTKSYKGREASRWGRHYSWQFSSATCITQELDVVIHQNGGVGRAAERSRASGTFLFCLENSRVLFWVPPWRSWFALFLFVFAVGVCRCQF